MPLTQNGIRYRETSKNILIKCLHQYRKLFWKLAEVMVKEGKLPDKELLFFLTLFELKKIIEAPNPSLIALAKLRKRSHLHKDMLKFHETTIGPEMKSRNDEENVDYSNMSKLKGVPVSSGKVIARCCVAFTLKDAKHIQVKYF